MAFRPCAAAPSSLQASLEVMDPCPVFGPYGLSALEFFDLSSSRPGSPQWVVAGALPARVPGVALRHVGGRRAFVWGQLALSPVEVALLMTLTDEGWSLRADGPGDALDRLALQVSAGRARPEAMIAASVFESRATSLRASEVMRRAKDL